MRPSSPSPAFVPSRCVPSVPSRRRRRRQTDRRTDRRTRSCTIRRPFLSLTDHTETRLCTVYDSIETIGRRRHTGTRTQYNTPSHYETHTHDATHTTHPPTPSRHCIRSRHACMRAFVRVIRSFVRSERRSDRSRDSRPVERARHRHVARDSRLADDRDGGADEGTTGREMRESPMRDASSRTRASTRAMRDFEGDARGRERCVRVRGGGGVVDERGDGGVGGGATRGGGGEGDDGARGGEDGARGATRG